MGENSLKTAIESGVFGAPGTVEAGLRQQFAIEIGKRVTPKETEALTVISILFYVYAGVPQQLIPHIKKSLTNQLDILKFGQCPVYDEVAQMVETLGTTPTKALIDDDTHYTAGEVFTTPAELMYIAPPILLVPGASESLQSYLQSDIAKSVILKIKAAKAAAVINYRSEQEVPQPPQ